MTNPSDLKQPETASCFTLDKAISYQEPRGLLKIVWELRLERGSYVSELVDDEGTYFRGPPGTVYVGRPEMKNEPANLGTHITRDGGIWISHDPTVKPRVYTYFSVQDAKAVVPAPNVDCHSFAMIRDPDTHKYSIAAAAVGGAAGGLLARAASPGSSTSYAQAGLGGAIGVGLVAALINSGVGEIAFERKINNGEFIARIRSARDGAIPLNVIAPPTEGRSQ